GRAATRSECAWYALIQPARAHSQRSIGYLQRGKCVDRARDSSSVEVLEEHKHCDIRPRELPLRHERNETEIFGRLTLSPNTKSPLICLLKAVKNLGTPSF